MAFRSTLKLLAPTVFALALSQTGFAAPISGCTNNPSSPTTIGGTLIASFTCNLYPTSTTYSIDLTPYMTQGGALLSNNSAGAGYEVILNGNPLTISANDTNDAALFNTALWDAVLYWPIDQPFNTSDMVTIFYPGAFPSASVVKSLDESLYGPKDSNYFLAATPNPVVFGGGSTQQYNIFLPTAVTATPEPSSIVLLFSGMLSMGLVAGRKYLRNPLVKEI